LPASAVVGAFDPGDDRQAQLLAGGPALSVENVLCSSEKNDSLAALSPHAATRPIDPSRPLLLSVRTNAWDRNWADSTGRRNTLIVEVLMGRPAGWMTALTGRSPMKSPGAPSHRREVEREFWREIAKGLLAEEAALAVGASQAVGARWFRHGSAALAGRPFGWGD